MMQFFKTLFKIQRDTTRFKTQFLTELHEMIDRSFLHEHCKQLTEALKANAELFSKQEIENLKFILDNRKTTILWAKRLLPKEVYPYEEIKGHIETSKSKLALEALRIHLLANKKNYSDHICYNINKRINDQITRIHDKERNCKN